MTTRFILLAFIASLLFVQKITVRFLTFDSFLHLFWLDEKLLLFQEMRVLQSGMMSILSAYISGNWSEIDTTAGKT